MNEHEPRRREGPTPVMAPAPGPLVDLDTLTQLEELKSQQIELELQVHELQAKQQESEVLLQHYSSLFDWSPVRFVCLDQLGRIRQVNQAAAGLLGRERSRLLGAYLTQYLALDDRDKLRHLIWQAQPEGRPAAAVLHLRHQAGNFQFLAQGVPCCGEAEALCQVAILDAAGPVGQPTPAGPTAGQVAAGGPAMPARPDAEADVRGHAQAEQFIAKLVKGLQVPQEQLQAQVQLVRAWLESMPDGVVLCDAQGKILCINSTAAFLLADLIESTPVISHAADCWEEELFYRADRQTPYSWEDFPLRRALNGETLHREKLWIRRPGNRSETWLEISGSPLWDPRGSQCGAAFLIRQRAR